MNSLDLSNQKVTINGETSSINFIELTEVKPGVQCGVFTLEHDRSKDLGVIVIEPGFSTPLQRMVKGEVTVEATVFGKGKLMKVNADGEPEVFIFDGTSETSFSVCFEQGDEIQWFADTDSYLIAYEICYPPYEEGRFETILQP